MTRTLFVFTCLAACIALVSCGQKPPKPGGAVVTSQQADSSAPVQIRPGLWIVDPADNAGAPYKAPIYGTISEPVETGVWLLVHPVGINEYWVQRQAEVREDGLWRCAACLGLEDTPDGVRFEVRAVAGTKTELKSGSMLRSWPDAQYQSSVLTLVRQGK